MFLFNINVWLKNQFEKLQLLVKIGGLQQNVFYEPVFCKMWKILVVFAFFFGQTCLMFKNFENWYFITFEKQKNKKYHFEVLICGPNWLQLKNGQLGPDTKTSNLRAEIPIFIVFLTNNVL